MLPIIVYIANPKKKHENRTESIRIQLKRLQPPKRIGLSPCGGEGDRGRTLFWSSEKPRPEIHLTIKEGGEKYRGNLTRAWRKRLYRVKPRISRVAIVSTEIYPT